MPSCTHAPKVVLVQQRRQVDTQFASLERCLVPKTTVNLQSATRVDFDSLCLVSHRRVSSHLACDLRQGGLRLAAILAELPHGIASNVRTIHAYWQRKMLNLHLMKASLRKRCPGL